VTRDQIQESVKKSLDRLGVDYIDLLQVHWPDRYVSLFGGGPYDQANQREGDASF
jgi:aryl-alcohol dehydrogenase-like predicted oxidoreductase